MEIQDRIVEGANDMFMRYGVKAVTMDDIARQLGISKKTIYQYFENKDKLVQEVTLFTLKEQEKAIVEIEKTSLDPIDEILKLAEHTSVMLQNMNPSLLYEVEKYHPAAYQMYANHRKNWIYTTIVANLKKGIELGLFRKELDVDILATFRIEIMRLVFNPFVFPAGKYKFGKVQMQLLDHYLHGICTIKGHKLINKYKHIIEEE